MNPHIATIVYLAGIIGLFFLDRDPKERVSKALWIPVLWLLIIGSRPVSMWLQTGPTISQADQYMDGSPIDATVFGILIVAGVLILISRSRQVHKVLRMNMPLVLFFLYCALSIAWSDYSFIALKRWIKSVGDLVMVLVVVTDPDPLAAMKRIFSRAAFLLLPLSILFIKYYPDIGRSYNQWTWEPMYCGVTTFKNLLGMTCLVCGLGSFWSFMGAYEKKGMPHRMRRLAAHGIILAATVWLLRTADSMTSLSCFLMAAAVMVITTRRWVTRRTIAVHALVACFLTLSLCALFVDPRTMLSSLGRDPTLTGRRAIWTAVLSLHTNPLIGTGFESFWLGSRLERVWEMTEKGIQEAHNGYLEVYLNLGLAGLALLTGVILSGYRDIIVMLRRDPQAGRIRLAFLTAGLIYSMTEAGFRMLSPIWFAFLLAVTFIPSKPRRNERSAMSLSRAEEFNPQTETADMFGSRLKPFDTYGAFVPSVPGGGDALRRVAVKSVGVTVFSGSVTLVIQMVATVVLARLLTPRDFGLVAMVTTFSLLLVNVGLNGITEAVVQREQIDHTLASNLFWINLIGSLLLTISFATAGSLVARFYGEPLVAPIVAGISATIFLTGTSVLHLALLKRAMEFAAVARNDVIAKVVSVAVSILFALTGWGYWALVFGACALPLSTTVGAWVLCRWIPGRPRRAAGTGTMLQFAIHTYGRFSVNYFARNTDNLLVGWRFGAHSLGFYKKAYDLFALSATQLVSSTTVVAVSALSRVRGDRVQYRRYLLGAMAVMAFVGMGLAGDLTLTGKDLIRLLLGPGWEPAGRIFTYFAPGIGLMILYSTHGWIHLSIGRADRWFLWGIVELIVTCLLFLIGLHWGPDGIAVAWCASFWILTIPAMWYAGRPIGLGVAPLLAVVWRYILAALLAGGMSDVIYRFVPLSGSSGAFGAAQRIGCISISFGGLYLIAVMVLHGGLSPLKTLAGLLREMLPAVGVERPLAVGAVESGSRDGKAQPPRTGFGGSFLVSILIPAHNSEEWIADAMRSALAQTWEPKEIIVVDDGSKDRTLEIAQQFKSEIVRVVTQRNQGASAARNLAFSLSRGEYIQWLDADDLLAPDKIARQMEVVEQGAGKRILLSSEFGRFMHRSSHARFTPTALWEDLSPAEWLLRKMGRNLYMQTATWLVSRELTVAAGPWDTRLLGDDDGEYFCRVLMASDGIQFVPGSKVYYRCFGYTGLSYMGRSPQKLTAHWLSMRLHIGYLQSLEQSDRVRAACLEYLRNSLIYFYPERRDIVATAEQMAEGFGAQLGVPSLSWKYSWIEKVFGWSLVKPMQRFLRRIRWWLERQLDKALFGIQDRKLSAVGLKAKAGLQWATTPVDASIHVYDNALAEQGNVRKNLP